MIKTIIERLQEQTWEKQLDQDRYNGKDDKFTTTILLKDGKVEVELSTTKYEEDKLKWASLKVNVDDANIDIFGEGETFEQHISSLISKLKQLGGITWG